MAARSSARCPPPAPWAPPRGGLHIAFLAARADVIGIENPRQVSAYHYPSQYGPRSPTFSRAGLVKLGGRDMLFISGTASIVGHQTLHDGDVAAQTRECLHNIAAIVAEANRQAPGADFRLDNLAYKVYVRHPEDLDTVRREMAQFIGAPVSAVFLQADVCRADLLVEIEASGGHAIGPASAGQSGTCHDSPPSPDPPSSLLLLACLPATPAPPKSPCGNWASA